METINEFDECCCITDHMFKTVHSRATLYLSDECKLLTAVIRSRHVCRAVDHNFSTSAGVKNVANSVMFGE